MGTVAMTAAVANWGTLTPSSSMAGAWPMVYGNQQAKSMMGKPWMTGWLLLSAAAWGLSGCGWLATVGPGIPLEAGLEADSLVTVPDPTPAPAVAPDPAPDPAPAPDPFPDAINRATSAVAIGQSAQSAADWQLAVSRWQQAIALLEQVPSNSPNHGQAQTKIQEYREQLTTAQRRTRGPVGPTPAATALPVAPAAPPRAPALPAGLVAQIPIQRRQGGTPVVAVTLQGNTGAQTFPMLFDTGATGTLITAEMAQTIGVTIVGETQARIADGSIVRLPVGYLEAVEVGGLRREGLRVAIGGNYGLLGQDIYGQYGIAIGSHMIHLH
jgi:predicted aspartyl protease